MLKVSTLVVKVLALSLLFVAQAQASTECTIKGAVRCPCEASLMVKCDGKKGSFIKNNEKPEELRLQYQGADGKKTEMVVKNPSREVREYYTSGEGLLKFEEIQKALAANKISTEDIASGAAELKVAKVVINSNVKLYSNPKATPDQVVEEVTESFESCQYLGTPRIVRYKGRNTCMSYVECPGQFGQTVCATSGNTCPSTDTCVNDETIAFDNDDELPKFICVQYKSPQEKIDIPKCDPSGTVAVGPFKSPGSSKQSDSTGALR